MLSTRSMFCYYFWHSNIITVILLKTFFWRINSMFHNLLGIFFRPSYDTFEIWNQWFSYRAKGVFHCWGNSIEGMPFNKSVCNESIQSGTQHPCWNVRDLFSQFIESRRWFKGKRIDDEQPPLFREAGKDVAYRTVAYWLWKRPLISWEKTRTSRLGRLRTTAPICAFYSA